jgi:hypothetical protein
MDSQMECGMCSKEHGRTWDFGPWKLRRALRLRYPGYEWTNRGCAWVGLGNPCNNEDKDLLYASNNLTLGNGENAMFGGPLCLEAWSPEILLPPLSTFLRKWIFQWAKVLGMIFGFSNLSFHNGILVAHITDFYNHCTIIQEFHLNDERDTITWMLTTSRSTPLSQPTCPNLMCQPHPSWCGRIGPIPPTPNAKHFLCWSFKIVCGQQTVSFVVGGQIAVPCQLFKREPETVALLFFKCRYSLLIWKGFGLALGQTLTPLKIGGALSLELMVDDGKV